MNIYTYRYHGPLGAPVSTSLPPARPDAHSGVLGGRMAGDLRSALRCSEAERGGRDHAVLAAPAAALCIPDDTFFTMEARRLQRQTRGQRLEKGIVSTAVEVAVLLGLGGVGLAALRERIIGKPGVDVRYLSIPIVATSCIIGWAASNTLTVQDNLPAVWAKTWAWLLCVWAMWLYEPNGPSAAKRSPSACASATAPLARRASRSRRGG